MKAPLNNPSLTPTRQRGRVKRQVRRWVPYAGAVVLVALIIAGLWPQPVPVETARATVGVLRATVNEDGKTRIKQRYLVSATVTGQLRRIPYKAGYEVQAGVTLLAVIDPLLPTLLDARSRSLAEARRDAAKANLEKARAGLEFAQSELRRFEKLFAEKTVSVQELDSVRWRAASATQDKEAAEGALRQAEAELGLFMSSPENHSNYTNGWTAPVEIKAPVDGRVLRLFEESSRVVTVGTPLLEVGDPTDLEVVIEVLSRDGAIISPGAKVELEQWGGREPLQARVRLVEPAAFTKISALGVEEQRVNVIADLVTPPEQRTGVGDAFRVEARIIVWEAQQALKVPSGTLFRHGQQWATFVVSSGRARLRPVKAGRASDTETQILSGLTAGEKVILYPGDQVRDGQRVRETKI